VSQKRYFQVASSRLWIDSRPWLRFI